MAESLLNITKRPVDEVVGPLLDQSEQQSKEAGVRLTRDASSYGLGLADYLKLACQGDSEHSGYEHALAYLNLPVQDDFNEGVVLQAASNTFKTHPGTRALFPEVIDDMIRFQSRQPIFEVVDPMLSNSRTIDGAELISTVIKEQDDDPDPYRTSTVPEGARIPVRSLRTSESSVRIYKHGSALRTTFEFNRRASIDLLTPHANRIARELEASKVTSAVNVMINGDGVNPAATEFKQSADTSVSSTTGSLDWQALLYWLVQRAKNGTPVDTVIGNWDAAFEWANMWATTGSNTQADAENFQAVMSRFNGIGQLNIPMPNFAVASAMPNKKLLGITVGETLEELVEAGANIQESERAILNQTITMTKTESTGYKLVFDDTRQLYNYDA